MNAPAPLVPKNNYVQPVPDHCDRIVWRNFYYHLPIDRDVKAPAPAPQWHEPSQGQIEDFMREWDDWSKWSDIRAGIQEAIRRFSPPSTLQGEPHDRP